MAEVVEFGIASEVAPAVSRLVDEVRQPLRNAKETLGTFLVVLDRNRGKLPPELRRTRSFLDAAHAALVAADHSLSYGESAAYGQEPTMCTELGESVARTLAAAIQQLPEIPVEK